jgi:hypothetical protein
MFISKNELGWMNRQIGDLQNRVQDQAKSLAALAEYFELYRVVMQPLNEATLKYEKKCKKCNCCPSLPLGKQKVVKSLFPPSHPSFDPFFSFTYFKQCNCKCHKSKK